jgi:soluble lytic murein transglycosylase-like protein
VAYQLTDPRTNIHTGARMLARFQAQFPERLELVVAAYNAGAGAVRRAGRQVPDIAETRKYVQTVMQIYEYLLPPRTLQRNRQFP